MRSKLVIVIIIIGLIAGAAGLWYWQKNIYSKGLLRLEILGSEETELLSEVEYIVKYKNTGNVTLEGAKLVFEYPEYSVLENPGPLREEVVLNDIFPGEEKSQKFTARLLGREGEAKEAKATLYYRPKGLRAAYESDTAFLTVIKNVPISFEIDMPLRIESGKETKASLNYFSGLDYPLDNLRVKMEYPAGFDFQKGQPKGVDETEWELGALNKAEGGRIDIYGRLSGQLNEQKSFKASLGIWQENEFVLLKETSRVVKIAKPSLDVFQRINGKENYIAKPGEWLHYEVFFRNTGQEPFHELFLVVKLEGDALNSSTLKTENGQLNKEEKSIIWDWQGVPELQLLASGQEGRVEFWVKLQNESDDALKRANALIRDSILISEIQLKFETKVASRLGFASKAYFEDEIFGNEGPLPPEVGETTTYTIVWQAEGCCNEVKNVKAKAILPANVSLSGQVFPEGIGLTFDSKSREVVWEIGSIGDPQATTTEPRSCAFQVSLKPSASQRGGVAGLMGEGRLYGEDQWTESTVESIVPAIDTSLPDDKAAAGKGIVQ